MNSLRCVFGSIGLIAAVLLTTPVQATFSICAVDPGTGEVGSAGASCIAGSRILSDVHPGVGVIHTQAYWNSQNQNYARQLMAEGFSPQEIVDMVVANDSQGNPTIRQYGVVDLVDGGRSAGYTGVNCTNWKGHTLAPVYAIQGNILLGPEIVDDMEAAFLGTVGSLAERLIAALQAAKRPGADTRCANKSAISAFLRVGRFNDSANNLFLDLNVADTASNTDPIDVLQGLFDDFMTTASVPGSGGPGDWGGPGSPGGAPVDGTPGGAGTPGSPGGAPVDGTPGTPGGAGTPGGSDEAGGAESGDDVGVLRLHPVTPNPTKGQVEVVFELREPRAVRLSVFDAQGRVVEEILARSLDAGTHRVRWNWSGPGGVYFLRLESGEDTVTRKVGTVD